VSGIAVSVSPKGQDLWWSVGAESLKTFGLALIFATLFDLTKNTKDFVDKISKILRDIVVSRSFLREMNEADKRNVLSKILMPSDENIGQHLDTAGYFKKKIDDLTSMFISNFKSRLVLDIKMEKDKSTGLVTANGTLSYRIHRVESTFAPLVVKFEKQTSEFLKRSITCPNGKIIKITKDDCEEDKENNVGINWKKYVYRIKDEENKHPYLTVECEVKEPGHSHWSTFQWQSLTPYDGLHFKMECKDDLVIKEHLIYDEGGPYQVEIGDNRKTIKINAFGWLDAFSGFSVTVGEEHTETDADRGLEMRNNGEDTVNAENSEKKD